VAAAKPRKAGMYAVKRHPRYDLAMKPPVDGASSGPQMTVAPNVATAAPR